MLGRAIFGAAGALVLVAGCGNGGAVDSGHWANGGATAPPPSDGGADLAGAWPQSDPNPNAPPAGSPTFDDPDAGVTPSTFRCSAGAKGGASGDTTITLTSSGGSRDAYVHVPASYDPTKGAMLVVNYHGFSSNAPEEIILGRMNEVADARGFVTVYPDGVASSWNAGACCGVAWNDSVDDVQFTKDLLAKIAGDYCIDPARVYATGMSNGGFMSHRLGCAMSDVFAAVAPVAGVLGIDPAQCTPGRAVPVIDFHGTADPIVPYKGGTPVSPVDLGNGIPITFRSVDDTIAAWRTIDRCEGVPTKIYSKGDAACVAFGACAGGAEVVQCTIDGGGHTWPGGVPVPFLGATSSDLSATNAMIDFFVAHPMPARTTVE